MKVLAIIPARYGSTRFPGKPLAKIKGKPMIQWVYEAVKRCSELDDVIIATDDERIEVAAKAFGGKVEMTQEHKTGSDRIREVISRNPCDVVVNVQGDEPLITPEVITAVLSPHKKGDCTVSTLRFPITNADDPNIAKVVCAKDGRALYFSRSTIPFPRETTHWYKHIGIYAFRSDILEKFSELEAPDIERAECLEQLRLLYHGIPLIVVDSPYDCIGVDLPEHIEKVEKIIGD